MIVTAPSQENVINILENAYANKSYSMYKKLTYGQSINCIFAEVTFVADLLRAAIRYDRSKDERSKFMRIVESMNHLLHIQDTSSVTEDNILPQFIPVEVKSDDEPIVFNVATEHSELDGLRGEGPNYYHLNQTEYDSLSDDTISGGEI